jgi:hypothetical protein
MACDICGKTGVQLEDLMEQYQTKDIKQICSDCSSDVNKHLDKLRSMTFGIMRTWLKKYMANKKKF